jgi:lipopolysaccharide export system protein LptA
MLVFVLWSGLCSLAYAGSGANEPGSQQGPVEVTAERMISESKANQIIFSGNVEARRGELYVKADRLEVLQEPQSKKVSQMVAIGNVYITKGEQAATASRATFHEREQKVVLTGNPHAWEGSSEVWGEEMVLLLAEDKMIVTGGAQRVRVQMQPTREGIKLPTAKAKGQGG